MQLPTAAATTTTTTTEVSYLDHTLKHSKCYHCYEHSPLLLCSVILMIIILWLLLYLV
jgi:hypothetical protein